LIGQNIVKIHQCALCIAIYTRQTWFSTISWWINNLQNVLLKTQIAARFMEQLLPSTALQASPKLSYCLALQAAPAKLSHSTKQKYTFDGTLYIAK
jgi:hypothetical protein